MKSSRSASPSSPRPKQRRDDDYQLTNNNTTCLSPKSPSSPTMKHVSIDLPEDHSPASVRRAHYVHGSHSHHQHTLPDLLDHDDGAESQAPSLTSCSVGSSYSTYTGASVESLRSQQSGQLMDETFDDLSDGDESDAEVSCRRRAVDWRNNSLLTAGRVALSGDGSGASGSAGDSQKEGGQMLVRADTMDVVEQSHGTKATTAGCHLPDEVAFTNQYLSTLFCGLGEVMGCGGGR